MHVEIVLAALVMVVAVLVAADFFRRTSDAPHEYPAGNEQGSSLDAVRETYPASRAGSAFAPILVHQPARKLGDAFYALMQNALYAPLAAHMAGRKRDLSDLFPPEPPSGES